MQRLELTWIGKGQEPAVEPRILIHDPSKDYGDPDSPNMLIHGDNLLALKALEQQYAGQVKCIYIDPPYNTGAAFEHYDDNLEHSIWLRLMKARLEILKNLLSADGGICVQIDATEMAYLKVIMDEVFNRSNFLNIISVKTKVAGVSGSNMGRSLQDNIEYILLYARDKNQVQLNPVYVKQKLFSRIKEYELEGKSWKYTSVMVELSDKILLKNDDERGMTFYGYKTLKTMSIAAFARENGIEEAEVYNKYADRIFQTTNAQSSVRQTVMRETDGFDFPMIGLEYVPTKGKNAGKKIEILYKGEQRRMMMFLSDAVEKIDGEYFYLDKINTLWDDIQYNNLTKEGNVQFPNGKKPESLVGRVIEMLSNPGDLVLDSFLGSGTTCAAAHKMRRRWIGVELGSHCYTHCIPRMQSVVDGLDSGGITKLTNWQGGGGYKFYELAPTLIVKDRFGNSVFSDQYNAQMLVAAVTKVNGYFYAPDPEIFWKQGYSQDNSFIYVTTQYLTAAMLDSLAKEVGALESLLICAPAFDVGLNKRYDNITVKKIPQSVLNKCEYGVDNYNLNIVEVLECDEEEWDND